MRHRVIAGLAAAVAAAVVTSGMLLPGVASASGRRHSDSFREVSDRGGCRSDRDVSVRRHGRYADADGYRAAGNRDAYFAPERHFRDRREYSTIERVVSYRRDCPPRAYYGVGSERSVYAVPVYVLPDTARVASYRQTYRSPAVYRVAGHRTTSRCPVRHRVAASRKASSKRVAYRVAGSRQTYRTPVASRRPVVSRVASYREDYGGPGAYGAAPVRRVSIAPVYHETVVYRSIGYEAPVRDRVAAYRSSDSGRHCRDEVREVRTAYHRRRRGGC